MRGGRRRRLVRLAVALTGAVLLCSLVAGPVDALLDRLASVPLGPGTAVITWSGRSGVTPTITSVQGAVHGYPVNASGRVPGISDSYAGTASTPPASVTLATVDGRVGGEPFSLTIHLDLVRANDASPFGSVSGSLHGQPVSASLLPPSPESQSIRFVGSIGALHVTGTIGPSIHHGNRSTAHASFDVTRG